MKRLWIALAAASLAACAHLPNRVTPDGRARANLWHEAHIALYQEDFSRADSLFTRLAFDHADAVEGREALFYVGTLHIDPRNDAWNSERAETALWRYLQQDTTGVPVYRRPEATTLLELARQLNLPPEQRVSGLRTEAAPPAAPVVERRIAPTAQLRELQEENERLQQQLSQRDEQIQRQREELDRIRRALTPRTPPE